MTGKSPNEIRRDFLQTLLVVAGIIGSIVSILKSNQNIVLFLVFFVLVAIALYAGFLIRSIPADNFLFSLTSAMTGYLFSQVLSLAFYSIDPNFWAYWLFLFALTAVVSLS